MKIISLSSINGGEACSIFTGIKQHFYNNDCITDFFSYLEISLEAINQVLTLNNKYIDFYFNSDLKVYKNKDNGYSIIFGNFDKIISHHDLKDINLYNDVIEKYKRRYYRLINDIKTNDKIFFIRYGNDNDDIKLIINFIEIIKNMNPNLKFHYININYINNLNISNYHNFQFNINDKKIYSDDIFYKILEYNWKELYDYIYNLLDDNEKDNFHYYV